MTISEMLGQFQQRCDVGYLATCRDGRPHVRPMSPLAAEGRVLWMATGQSSDKMADLHANPQAEFCYMDAEYVHLRARGAVTISHDAERKKQAWEAYPILARYFRGPEDEQFCLLKLDVAEILHMPAGVMEYQVLRD